MSRIVPAIIPESFEHLSKTLNSVKKFTREVQVDIVDGIFVPFTSWPYAEKSTISELKKLVKDFEIELDLMIERPEEVLELYLNAGVKKCVIHLEGVKNYNKLICLKHEYDFSLGLSINNDTPIEDLIVRIGDADYVQLMGIASIGRQGNPFDSRVLERVSILTKTYPELSITVDGSVNKKTIPKLSKAGVKRFAVGSAILGAKEPKLAYAQLTSLAKKHVL